MPPRVHGGNRIECAYANVSLTWTEAAVGLQGLAFAGGRHLGHGYRGHQGERGFAAAAVAGGHPLYLRRPGAGGRYLRADPPLPEPRPSAGRHAAGCAAVSFLLDELHGAYGYHRLEQLVSHHALRGHGAVSGAAHPAQAPDLRQRRGGVAVHRRRGVRGLQRRSGVQPSLRRPDRPSPRRCSCRSTCCTPRSWRPVAT